MDIRYKSIQWECFQDAPFVGTLISGISCGNKCKGCQNKDLKKDPNLESDMQEIIDYIKNETTSKGIIMGGLEWSEQMKELLEFCKLAGENDLQIMIYTGLEFDEFLVRVGEYGIKNTTFDHSLVTKMMVENDSEFFMCMGVSILDYYIPNGFYIKTGRYDNTKLTDDNVQHGIKLVSSNQKVIFIDGGVIDESN